MYKIRLVLGTVKESNLYGSWKYLPVNVYDTNIPDSVFATKFEKGRNQYSTRLNSD